MSLGAVLSSHDRCVTYSASNPTMVLHSSLKKEPTQSTTFWMLDICLKSRVTIKPDNLRIMTTFELTYRETHNSKILLL